MSSPEIIIIPDTTRSIRQKPMISFALSFAMARAGNAQKGCIRLVQASPHAIAIPVSPWSTPRSAPAANIIGACIAQCPPPEGTNILSIAAQRKVYIGYVVVVEMFTKASLTMVPRLTPDAPVPVMMPIMPA